MCRPRKTSRCASESSVTSAVPSEVEIEAEKLYDARAVWQEVVQNLSAARVARFFATCSAVALRLKLRPLGRSLAHLAQRKSRCAARFVADSATLDEARDLTRTFLHLRPFAYAARDRCLLDSLSLAEFLASYGIRATCIFGVRANPFEAHCWLQIGSHVVNETPEMAQRYAPILSV